MGTLYRVDAAPLPVLPSPPKPGTPGTPGAPGVPGVPAPPAAPGELENPTGWPPGAPWPPAPVPAPAPLPTPTPAPPPVTAPEAGYSACVARSHYNSGDSGAAAAVERICKLEPDVYAVVQGRFFGESGTGWFNYYYRMYNSIALQQALQ